MRIIYILLLFTIKTNLIAQTQIELNYKWCDKYKEADKDLNILYQKILNEFKTDTLFIKNLKKTQNNWIKLKKSDKKLYMPKDGNWYSAAPMCICQLLLEITEKRIEFLKKWVIGPENRNGWICGFGAINLYQ